MSDDAISLGAVGWARWMWRQLTSMRTALFLLLLLAIAAIPGAALPQRSIDPGAVAVFIADQGSVGRAMDAVGLFEVYRSPWFSAIYLLLFVSLIGCIVPRVRVYAGSLRRPPAATPKYLTRLPISGQGESESSPEAVLDGAEAALKKAGYRTVRSGDSVAGEKGYLREAGNLTFHCALVGVLVSVAVSHQYGYSGQALVPVGDTFTHSAGTYDVFRPGAAVNSEKLPPFAVTLKSFDVAFEENAGGAQLGQPRDFDADVDVTDASGAKSTQKLRVNEPVSVDGADVFLAGNGYAPRVTIKDAQDKVTYSGTVPFIAQDGMYTSSGVIKVPDHTATQLGIQAVFLPTAVQGKDSLVSVFPDARMPELVIAAYTGDLGLDRGVPQSVFRLDMRRLEPVLEFDEEHGKDLPFRARMRPGASAQLPDNLGTVTFDGFTRYAALSVRHDPGKLPALVFGVLLVAGLIGSLLVRRRRVWFRATPSASGAIVECAALSDSTDPHLADHLAMLSQAAVPQPVAATPEGVPHG